MIRMNPRNRRRATLGAGTLMAGLLATGCATLNESECRNADWRTIGFEDGARGASASRIGEHREACADHGISPDLAAYRQGRNDGLRQYCRAQNGFRLGERGVAYNGVCPADVEAEFQAAYEAGKRLHDASSRVRYTQSRIRNKELQLSQLKRTRQSKQAQLVSPGVSAARRAELLAETLEAARDQGAIEKEIDALKRELEEQREQLAQVKESSPYR
ncbi:MAG: DUF2799 domain-containing protein [Gammaproteobacteria bacterium]|nr:DUF2799 domain-containing protein [Gammaproteobacteria bacterium]